MYTSTIEKMLKIFQSVRKGVGMCMLYDLQNKNVFSVRLKLGYCWFGGHLSGGRVFQALGAATLNRSRKRFPADGSRSTNYSG